MPTVADILAVKSGPVKSISPDATILEAAVLMNEYKIGSLVVMEEDKVIGIITERDLLQRVLAQRKDPENTLVQDVMTSEVICCRPHTTLQEIRFVMKMRKIRHLPVADEERRLHGLVSIGDINAHETHNNEATIHLLHEYIQGRV